MKLKHYILCLISISSICYGIFAFWSMVLNCQAPLYIECVGAKLNKHKTIAISNKVATGSDTIYLNYPQSKAIMPSTLGVIKYDNSGSSFILQNNSCVYNPDNGKPSNYFLPFAHTIVTPWYSKGKYFSGNEIIPEHILIANGVKYNSAVGTKENRVSVQLLKFKGNTYLIFKDDGIQVKYLVRANSNNYYDVFLNTTVISNNKFIFQFDNTTSDTGRYTIEVKPTAFSFIGAVKDKSGKCILNVSENNSTFEVGGFLFKVSPKYTIGFSFLYALFLVSIVVFQLYFFYSMLKFKSEVYESLYSIRILINSLVFLGVPIFLTSYYLGVNRSLYLFLVVLLNLSYFTPKNILHKASLLSKIKYSNYLIYIVLFVLVIILWRFTSSELFLGRIPILHIQKIVLLLVIFVTQISFFGNGQYGKWVRLAFIIGFSVLVSLLTSDLGSCIYTGLSMLLIELIKKTLKLKYVLLFSLGAILLVVAAYNINPSLFTGSKSYRIVAPYTIPSSDDLMEAKQADRETYAGINYILKNRLNTSLPTFNKLVVPASFRSTMHTDFSFLWSFAFGGYTFALIFAFVIIALSRELILLLYLCTRMVRVNKERYFSLPVSREGELVRFYLAFTLIQFVYPICFSLLLLPLTGQSLCALAVSNWEIVFLAVLLVALHSVFTNPIYFTKTSKIQYAFSDAKKSIRFVITFFIVLLLSGFIYKYYTIFKLDEAMQWQKYINDEDIELKKQIPTACDKESLVAFSKIIVGNDDLTSVASKKKPILKELSSLYFSNKPYSHTVFESRTFNISSNKMLAQMSVDTIFRLNREIVSGRFAPFGLVYSKSQIVNNKPLNSVSNKYYTSIPAGSETINGDLTAECTKEIEDHIQSIGIASNIGAVMIVENQTGRVIANSSYPISTELNSNQVHYLIGSLKKLIIAYAGLQLLPNAKNQSFNGKTFKEFIQTSDDIYSANLLKSLLLLEKNKFSALLLNDFGLPLHSITDDSYFDTFPSENDFKKALDKNNSIYRLAIGQQAPYTLETVLKWYSRIASGLKVDFKYTKDKTSFEKISMNDDELKYLKECFNSVLYGTASKVREPLISNGINIENLWCKTGTAERADKSGNNSSSIIICNDKYSIAVMLKGNIPHNSDNYSAKDLFISLIPILKKYDIMQ